MAPGESGMTDEMSIDDLHGLVDRLQSAMNRIHRHMGQVEVQRLDGRTLYWDLCRMHEEVVEAVERINAHGRAVDARTTEEKEAQTGRYELGQVLYADQGGEPLVHLAPGVFVYSGLGMGHLHLPDGRIAWRNSDEARQICAREGLEYVVADPVDMSQSGGRGPSVFPKRYRIGYGACVNCGAEQPTPGCRFCGRLVAEDSETREDRHRRAKRDTNAARRRYENMQDDFEQERE